MKSAVLPSKFARYLDPSRNRDVCVTGPNLAPKNPHRSKGTARGYWHPDKHPDWQRVRHGNGKRRNVLIVYAASRMAVRKTDQSLVLLL